MTTMPFNQNFRTAARRTIRRAAALLSICLFAACSGNLKAPQQQPAAAGDLNQLIDTSKLKGDLKDIQDALASGKLPDTNKLKGAAKDILGTAAKVLSDSGISKMGNSGDPSQKAAQDAAIKMRNASGLTPAALDSLKKAAASLNNN
jgi:hypothetical protein